MLSESDRKMTQEKPLRLYKIFFPILCAVLVFFEIPSELTASEWTCFHGDQARKGYTSSSTQPPLQQIYKVTLGDLGYSSPIKVKNKVVVGTKGGKIVAYDAFDANGTKLWEYQTGGAIDSTACAQSGAVYVSSWDGNLYALNESTGSLLWTFPTGSTALSSPVIANGVVYVGAGHPADKLLAVNAATKSLVWEHAMTQPVYSSPAVEGNAVYVGSNDAAFHKVDLSSGNLMQMFSTGGSVYLSSPVVVNDILYGIGGDYSKNLYAVNMTTGQVVWQYVTGTNTSGADDTLVKVSSPAVANGVVYLSAGFPTQKLYAVDAAAGVEKWKKSLGSIGTTNILSSPVVAGNVVFVGGANGILYSFDAQSGADLGTIVLDGAVLSTPALASGMLYATTTAGSLYAFRIGADKDTVTPSVSFNSPSQNQEVGNKVDISATVSDEHLKSVTLSYGAGASPASFTDVYSGYEELSNQKLATWDTTALAEGVYTLKLRALDIVDNAKEATLSVKVSHRVPTLTMTSPQDNLLTKSANMVVSGTVDGTTVTVTVNGNPVTVAAGAFQTTLTLSSGVNTVTVSATNDIGNSITVTRNVTFDADPPVVKVTSPSDGGVVNSSQLSVSGTATDASGIKQLLVNGQSVSVASGGAFSATLNIAEGQNTVTVVATDNADNSATVTLKVTLDTAAPQITLNSPLDKGDFTTNNPAAFTVSGKVSKVLSSLKINGEAVSVAQDLNFTKSLNLAEGKNVITVDATDLAGNKSSLTRTVTLDTAKVALNITAPAQGYITNKKTVDVAGETEVGANLKVNGNAATVDSVGKFKTTVTLANENAKNTITVSASDGAGNETVVTRDVIHDSKPPKGSLSVKLGGSGKAKTIVTDVNVTLQLDATDENGGVKMMVAADDKFTGASWEDFSAAKTFALWKDSEYGKKKVCVKYKDIVDNETSPMCSEDMERVKEMIASTSFSVSADGAPGVIGSAGTFQLGVGKLPYSATATGDVIIVKPDVSSLVSLDNAVGDAIEIRFFGFSESAKLMGTALARVPADLVMYYSTDSDDEAGYRIFMYRQSTGKWEKVPGFQEVDTKGNKVRATVQLVLNASTIYRLAKDTSVNPQQPATLATLNYPNPVHGDTTFSYSLSSGIPTRVTIEVYNIKGTRVLFMEDPTPTDGIYKTSQIDALSNGVYIYKTTVYTASETITRNGKIVILK